MDEEMRSYYQGMSPKDLYLAYIRGDWGPEFTAVVIETLEKHQAAPEYNLGACHLMVLVNLLQRLFDWED